MLPVALGVGLPVAAIAAAVVYADAARRDHPPSTRLRWTGGVAAVSLAGFVGAFGLDSALYHTYATTVGPPVVVSPLQLVASMVVVGLVVSTAAVFAYGLGTRMDPPGAA